MQRTPSRDRKPRFRHDLRRVATAALVCLCFALQQVLVPLHLARNEHVYAGELARHVHPPDVDSHAGHGHGHEHGHEHRTNRGDHHPHPANDHLEEIAEPAVSLSLSHATVAIPPAAPAHDAPDAPGSVLPADAESCPRPPPPRTAADPRAPPS